jgi:ABC-type dipeptide/oligopeptide/nickel transport system permease component
MRPSTTHIRQIFNFTLLILTQGILLLWFIFSVNFIFLRLILGSPLEGDPPISVAITNQKATQLGLDRSIATQYWLFIQAVGQGNWGNSLVYPNHPISTIIANAWPRTLFLGFTSFILALMGGLSLALLTQQRWIMGQKIHWFIIFLLNSLPTLVLGPLLVWFFSFKLGFLPSMGWLKDGWSTLILPLITLSLPFAGSSALLLAHQLTLLKTQPFIQNMHALGLSPWSCQIKQMGVALLLPIIYIGALVLSQLLMGSIVVEQVFHIPGMGMIFIHAIKSRDYPLIQALITLYALLLILINGFAHALAQQLDPRLQRS